MVKLKMKLTIDVFQVKQTMLPSIPAPIIVPTDEGSLIRKPDDLPEGPLVTPPPEFIITETRQQVITDLNEPPQDKGKKISTEPDSPMRKFRMYEGWSQEQIDQALEESIRIQALKYNSNMMMGISSLF